MTTPAAPSQDEAQRLIDTFDLEEAKARRPFIRVAAAGFFSTKEDDKISFGLSRAEAIGKKART